MMSEKLAGYQPLVKGEGKLIPPQGGSGTAPSQGKSFQESRILRQIGEQMDRHKETGNATAPLPGGIIDGVGPDAPVVTNEQGAKQSGSPFRCDLLPARAVLEVAKVLKYGAAKYGDNNWRGISVADHINHLLTHVLAYGAGDTSDDHLSHAACRALMALEKYLEKSDELRDQAPAAGWQ